MDPLGWAYIAANFGVAIYLVARVGARLSTAMLLLAVLLIFYGPAHLIFHTSRETEPERVVAITWALLIMWAGILGGMEIATALAPRRWRTAKSVVRHWDHLPLSSGYAKNTIFRGTVSVILGILALDLLAEGHLAKIAAYYAGGGLLEDKAQLRQDEGGSTLYVINLLTLSIAPYASFVLLAESRRLRTGAAKLAALAAILIVFLAKLATLQKSPAAVYVLQLSLVYWLVGTNRVQLSKIALVACIFAAFMVPLTMTAFPELPLDAVLTYFGYRIFEVPQEVLLDFFSIYPDQLDFLMGGGIRLLHALTGEGTYQSPALVVAAMRDSEGASFNALFIGDAWAEFSYAGVAFTSVGLGLTTRAVDIWCFSTGKSSLSIGVMASMLFAIIYVSAASFSAALLSGGMALVPLLAWILKTRISSRRSTPHRMPALT